MEPDLTLEETRVRLRSEREQKAGRPDEFSHECWIAEPAKGPAFGKRDKELSQPTSTPVAIDVEYKRRARRDFQPVQPARRDRQLLVGSPLRSSRFRYASSVIWDESHTVVKREILLLSSSSRAVMPRWSGLADTVAFHS